jgi:hypothetical protein
MSCINKSLPGYKKIASIFNEDLAEKIIRGYSKNVKKLKDDFYYPTLPEIKKWVTGDKLAVYNTVVDALTVNPFLSEQGIRSFLSGVVTKYNDAFFITKGNLNESLTLKQEYIETIFKPNYDIMKRLEERFPDIFKIKDTKSTYTKVVEITPRIEKATQSNLFFQQKNIFNSIDEIEKNLKSLNKSAIAIGSTIKIENVLKKAGMDSELRDQFIRLLQDHPELRKIKIGNVLSTYMRQIVKDSDRAYYKAIDEPLSKELEKTLVKYFDKFNIRREELDSLKEKFGVDSVGVFDVLAKTIYYAKNRNLLTLPEEYGHVFVELLGSISNRKAKNPLFTYLVDNIDKWDGYQRVFDQYKNIYVTDEGNYDIYKIKKEAIGQAIGIALVRNYKNNKAADKSFWNILFANDVDFWTKIQEVIDKISEMLKGISYANINVEVDNIAKDILSKNYDKLDRLQKDTSNYNLLSYSETIENQNKKDGGLALDFMKWYSNLGNIVTGSLAYRYQGATYRPEIDALHDIDMIVPSDIHKVDLNKATYLTPEQIENDRLYRKYTLEGNYREARKYKMSGNIKLDINQMTENNEYFRKIKQKYPDLDYLYTFFNQKANAYYITVNAIWSKDQSLKDRFKSLSGPFNDRLTNFTEEELSRMYLFDFFLRPETTEEYVTIKEPEYDLNLAHFNYAFYEKLNMMGRPKDAFDYQNWQMFDEKNILAPDFNDRLVYFQIDQSKTEAERINQLEQKVKTTGVSASEFAELNKLRKSSEVKKATKETPTKEVYITYTPKGKEKQAYKVVGSKIFNRQNVEVFKEDSVDRNKIYANVAVKEKRAKVVEYRGNQYIVNNRKQILSVATGKIMQWPENNGDRLAIINLAFMPPSSKPNSLPTQEKALEKVESGLTITPGEIAGIYNSRNQNLGSRRPMTSPEFMKIASDFVNLMNLVGKAKSEILEQLKCI